MKKKLSLRVICLVVAGMMLSGVLMVSAINGSPYEVLKNALFDAFFYENLTTDSTITVRVNGEIHHYQRQHFSTSDTTILSIFENHDGRSHMMFSTEELRMHSNTRYTGDPQRFQIYKHTRNEFNPTTMGNNRNVIPERDSHQMRLIELGLDMVVGDLRHHMSMTTQSDGTRRVSGAITGNQLPEMAQLLIDIMVEQDAARAEWFVLREGQTTVHVPMQSVTINRIYGYADINAAGYLIYLRVGANAAVTNIFGETNIFDVEIVTHLSEIGTSAPQSPIPNLEEVFRLDSASYATFTLDDYGNVDMDSIVMHSFFGRP
ncbi:MAG: hypothetical protein FWC89_00085 [Defluviitaleaceae bacterium]|nr:hypothetical protein [Defluviitaleaceae bacterium]